MSPFGDGIANVMCSTHTVLSFTQIVLITIEGIMQKQLEKPTKPCADNCRSGIKELSKHQLHCGICDTHLTSLLLCPRCGKRYGDTVYSITKRDGHKTISAGLVRFMDGVAYMAAPCWSHFVGMAEDEVLIKCKDRNYETEKVQ